MRSYINIIRYFSLGVFSLSLILSFQNCGKRAEFNSNGDGGSYDKSSLSFAVRYPSCQNGDSCAIAGQPLEFWVVDASIYEPSEDGKVHTQKSEDMQVTWTIKPASNIVMDPQQMQGNPGVVTMAAGLYDVHVQVAMNDLVGTRDFQVRVENSHAPHECLPLSESFKIDGDSQVVWSDKGTSGEYQVLDLNRNIGNHRFIDDFRMQCYAINNVSWKLGIGKAMPHDIGDGNPITVDFESSDLFTLYADVEVSMPGTAVATQILHLKKDIQVGDHGVCRRLMFADTLRILVNSISYRVGSTVELSLHVPMCWENDMSASIESVHWEVDGEYLDNHNLNVAVVAKRSGTIPVRATVTYRNSRAASIVETSFVIQGQTCAPCTPGRDYQCLDVWCPPDPEVQ